MAILTFGEIIELLLTTYFGARKDVCFLLTKFNSKSKTGDRSRGRLEGSLFNSYYTEV